MELELVTLFALFGVALVAGFIDAIAGGGGLLTVPALLATGMPPALVLGTNKLQSSFGSFSATWFYARKELLEWAMIWPAVICTFIGAAIGTLAVQTIDAAILERLLPFLLMAFACYFYFSPRVSDAESSRRLTPMLFALLVGGGVGFYDGFFGPGTGSFFCHRFRGAGRFWHGASHRPYQVAQLHLQHRLPAVLCPRWQGGVERRLLHGAGPVYRCPCRLQAGVEERGQAHQAAAGDRFPADVRQAGVEPVSRTVCLGPVRR